MRVTWAVVLLLALYGDAYSSGPPSWYVYKSDTLAVDVCNVVTGPDGQESITDFSAREGRKITQLRGVTTEYVVVPIILSRPPNGTTLVAQVKRRRYPSMGVALHHMDGGRFYAVAVFEAAFKLRDVTGFTFETPRGQVVLTQEAKLK